jgi:hypothetical protein
LDLSAGTRRERRRIDQACLILRSADATDPNRAPAVIDGCSDLLFTRRWATEPRRKLMPITRISGERANNTNKIYPKETRKPNR